MLCSPEERDCIEEEAKNFVNKLECENSCEGIYSDVCKLDETINNNHYEAMIAKYMEYKRGLLKNIGFNGSNYRTAFGKYSSLYWVKRLLLMPS